VHRRIRQRVDFDRQSRRTAHERLTVRRSNQPAKYPLRAFTSPLRRRVRTDNLYNPAMERNMKWITREHVKVDRVACPWLIRKYVDPDAELLFVPADQVTEVARTQRATSYDCTNDELGHHGKGCSFDAIVRKYGLDKDPALVLLAKIVNGADTDNTLWNQPESAGLNAIAEGFRHLGFRDDLEQNKAEWIVYDALYAYCQEMVRQGRYDGAFRA
jgi:hypothetical protein